MFIVFGEKKAFSMDEKGDVVDWFCCVNLLPKLRGNPHIGV